MARAESAAIAEPEGAGTTTGAALGTAKRTGGSLRDNARTRLIVTAKSRPEIKSPIAPTAINSVRVETGRSDSRSRAGKRSRSASPGGNTDEIAARKLDKAVSKGVIHKNQAANRKSAIAKQAAAL